MIHTCTLIHTNKLLLPGIILYVFQFSMCSKIVYLLFNSLIHTFYYVVNTTYVNYKSNVVSMFPIQAVLSVVWYKNKIFPAWFSVVVIEWCSLYTTSSVTNHWDVETLPVQIKLIRWRLRKGKFKSSHYKNNTKLCYKTYTMSVHHHLNYVTVLMVRF